MNFYNLFFVFIIIIIHLFADSSEQKQLDFISEFNKIETTPVIISFTNEFEINNTGGHLQGIQKYENTAGKYILLSGSSDSYSYCLVVKSDNENKVISVNRLMNKPFKHAGGFQIFQNYLAVGIEDNSKKNKAKVCVYDISEPEKQFSNPIAIIERNGEPLRNTAGCVGITNYNNRVLIAVGDWDTKHIDFYSSGFDKKGDKVFTKISSVDTENISKTNWINNEWHSYQNINLFNINEQLFLVGLGQNRQSENIADLYELTEYSSGNFSFKKVAAETFNCSDECSFKAGAGIYYANGEFKIFACGYNISNISYLNIFSTKKN